MVLWEIVHVPENPPCSQTSLSTVAVLAAQVEPRSANTLVRKLGQVAPLENLRHVKRVRRRSDGGKVELHVILCSISQGDDFMQGVPADVVQLIESHKLSTFVAKVAKFAASSKEEWEDQCRLWPTSYHPPCNIDGVNGFSEEDSKLICSFMKIALDLSRSDQFHNEVVNAAVIVDPSSREIIASAYDEITTTSRNRCSLKNAQSVITPKSSELENGELSRCCTSESSLPSYNSVACLHPWKWIEQTPPSQGTPGCTYYGHPLRHAALVAIESASARDCQMFPNTSHKNDAVLIDQALPFFVGSPAKRQKKMSLEEAASSTQQVASICLHSEMTRPYLCTGFDIFLVWEPCTMCAMALVHQRIRRIFFAFPNPNAGALGSIHRLHGEKSLNHHYSVFRIMVPRG